MARLTATISARQALPQVFIIDLAGELKSSVEPGLLNAYQEATSKGARVLILNFRQLAYKNSSGIKLLVTLLARANARGQRIFAAEMGQEYENIFQVTQIDQGITVYATEADALQAAQALLNTPGAPLLPLASRVVLAQPTVTKRSTDNWAKPIERLNIPEKPRGA